ncbi:MAG: NADH-quinone oxidoreductase subunit C [Proteobacteria bacterium]|nr:NADH-quinone oxidoreductase subunit C [Pseudomonadota bacterium]
MGEDTITLKKEYILPICNHLKTQGYNFLSDLTGVDLGVDNNPRFQVISHLYSISTHKRLRLKVNLPPQNPTLASVTSIWKTADWFEREAYDMFGITFKNHPNLTRILLLDQFEGYPLRKDYPLRGR